MPLQAKEQPDEQLVELLTGSGVETALSVLYERYSRTVFGVVLKFLGTALWPRRWSKRSS
jgi:hypothetical protein